MNTPPASGLQVVILAAGASRRLGSPKALARIRGETLVRRMVRRVAPLSARSPILVVPPRSQRLATAVRGLRVRLCANPLCRQGLSTSLRCGLRAARWSPAVLLVPVDLAQLSARDLRRLVMRWRGTPRRIAGRRLGEQAVTPLILPGRYFALVRRISGDSGLRDLVASLPPAARLLVDLPSAAPDIDTPAHLATARRRFR
jgi:molybdenum cofactor cytidylyltransferase